MKALIIDDELHARENLKILLEEFCPEVQILGSAEGVNDALQKIRELQPELLFLDIRMPSGAEGFELLESIPEKNFQVIFVTAFKDYAIKAFQSNAIHYLLKPVDIEDLKIAVGKAAEYQQLFQEDELAFGVYKQSLSSVRDQLKPSSFPHKITLHHNRGFKIVEVDSIVRIQASGNCAYLYFNDGNRYLDTRTLLSYESLLAKGPFFRTHKSHMVNLDYLSEYVAADGPTAVLKDGTHVPVSRARLQDFLKKAKGN